MIATRSAFVASLAIALLIAAPTVRADDTVRLLAGTGSISNAADARTITLKGAGKDDADTRPVCCWRKWCYSYCAPVCPPVAFAAPAYYAPAYQYAPPAQPGLPPPAPGPAAYYYQPNRFAPETIAVAPTPSMVITRPSIVVGYQGRLFSGSIALRPLAARLGAIAAPTYDRTEVAPRPRTDDTYRYDGGPSRTVPMPTPDPVSPTDPVPTTVPALFRVQMERSRSKVSYPAYGEKPASKPKIVDPLLVKGN
jgi:hypothetical protein